MAYTNKTTNYNLPQYADTDLASWKDNNTAFAIIDEQMKKNANSASSAASETDLEALKTRVSTLETNYESLLSKFNSVITIGTSEVGYAVSASTD